MVDLQKTKELIPLEGETYDVSSPVEVLPAWAPRWAQP